MKSVLKKHSIGSVENNTLEQYFCKDKNTEIIINSLILKQFEEMDAGLLCPEILISDYNWITKQKLKRSTK